jgi:hypothetical protein
MLIATFAMASTSIAASSIRAGSAPVSMGLAAASHPAAACGQVPVPLASASSYAVLASSTITSTGATALTGDLGLSPGTSVTGFPPGKVTGTQNVTSPGAKNAMANLSVAFLNASGRSNCAVTVAGNIGGQTLTAGLYKSTSSLAISSGDLTLSGGGNSNGVFVFQVASAFTTTSGRAVILSDGAQARNVYWEIGSSATIGTTSTMKGTIMAHDSVSMLTGSVLNGRAMAVTGEVSLAGTTIVVPSSSSSSGSTYPVTFTESGLPAMTSWSMTFDGAQNSSTSSTLEFAVQSGTYNYAVSLAGFIATPASGQVTVNGGPTGQAIAFAAGAAGSFRLMFTETGLPSGTTWSVTSGGVQNTSTTSTIGFTVASGSYAYTIGVVSNYSSGPSNGSSTINGAAGSQAIAFSYFGTGGGSTPGNGSAGGSSGLSSTEWDLIVVGVIAIAAAAIGGMLLLRRKA